MVEELATIVMYAIWKESKGIGRAVYAGREGAL